MGLCLDALQAFLSFCLSLFLSSFMWKSSNHFIVSKVNIKLDELSSLHYMVALCIKLAGSCILVNNLMHRIHLLCT